MGTKETLKIKDWETGKGYEMTIGSKEHGEILELFEKQFSEYRLDKEARGLWVKGIVYQCGETNALYTAFIAGYSAGRCVYLNQ